MLLACCFCLRIEVVVEPLDVACVPIGCLHLLSEGFPIGIDLLVILVPVSVRHVERTTVRSAIVCQFLCTLFQVSCPAGLVSVFTPPITSRYVDQRSEDLEGDVELLLHSNIFGSLGRLVFLCLLPLILSVGPASALNADDEAMGHGDLAVSAWMVVRRTVACVIILRCVTRPRLPFGASDAGG